MIPGEKYLHDIRQMAVFQAVVAAIILAHIIVFDAMALWTFSKVLDAIHQAGQIGTP